MLDRRLLVVAFCGVALIGLCAWRLLTNQPLDYEAQVRAATMSRPAPLFQGVDEHNEMFRLAAYLGRHRILVIFHDGDSGADQSPDVLAVQQHAGELRQHDVKVVGVSQAIPQRNRAALERLGEFPGPLISDVDGSIHQQWGRMSPDGRPLTGLFLIDRKGNVPYAGDAPRPCDDFEQCWKEIVR